MNKLHSIMSDDENDQNHNQSGVDMIDSLNKLFQSQNQLLENNNPTKFKYPFTGANHETLSWIFAAEKYLRINDFKTPRTRFRRIFSSMHDNYQNRYLMDTESDGDNLTFDKLKAWILREYPPPKTKYEFKLKLKSMIMYRNEDPNIAYARYKYKLSMIQRAIKTINEGINAEALILYPNSATHRTAHFERTKMTSISDEDQTEALVRMFVIRNDKPERDNDGKINKLVIKYIVKKDPKTLDEWKKTFQEMKRQLIPRVYDGQKEYEYVSYPADKDDDTIYIKKHHQPIKVSRQPTSNSRKPKKGKKRGRESNQERRDPPTKRRKTVICSRCQRSGHYFHECYAELDKDGNTIKSPAPKEKSPSSCSTCGKNNHKTHSCYFKNRSIRCNNCNQYGHIARFCTQTRSNPSKSNPSKMKNGFTRYPSQRKLSSPKLPISKPEVNTMNKSQNVPSTIDMIKQWTDNAEMDDSIRDSLHQFMDNLASSHPRN